MLSIEIGLIKSQFFPIYSVKKYPSIWKAIVRKESVGFLQVKRQINQQCSYQNDVEASFKSTPNIQSLNRRPWSPQVVQDVIEKGVEVKDQSFGGLITHQPDWVLLHLVSVPMTNPNQPNVWGITRLHLRIMHSPRMQGEENSCWTSRSILVFSQDPNMLLITNALDVVLPFLRSPT